VIGLLLDAGLPRGAAADLTADGWDVQHVTDLGLGAARDEDILATPSGKGGRSLRSITTFRTRVLSEPARRNGSTRCVAPVAVTAW
jgi:hypothetical protein